MRKFLKFYRFAKDAIILKSIQAKIAWAKKAELKLNEKILNLYGRK